MAYTFGARLDDDSYALTTIDEDQGTASTKGEINGVPFEGGGGGGSSDFHTATVTVEYIMPEGVSDVGELTHVIAYSLVEDHAFGITYDYSDYTIPLSDIVSGNQFSIPLYKDYPSNLYVEFDNANYYSVISNSQVVSGDATIDDYFLITGDCSLRVALVAND